MSILSLLAFLGSPSALAASLAVALPSGDFTASRQAEAAAMLQRVASESLGLPASEVALVRGCAGRSCLSQASSMGASYLLLSSASKLKGTMASIYTFEVELLDSSGGSLYKTTYQGNGVAGLEQAAAFELSGLFKAVDRSSLEGDAAPKGRQARRKAQMAASPGSAQGGEARAGGPARESAPSDVPDFDFGFPDEADAASAGTSSGFDFPGPSAGPGQDESAGSAPDVRSVSSRQSGSVRPAPPPDPDPPPAPAPAEESPDPRFTEDGYYAVHWTDVEFRKKLAVPFPASARRRGESKVTCVVGFRVDKGGRPVDLSLSGCDASLHKAFQNALMQWSLSPMTGPDGAATKFFFTMPVSSSSR